MDLFRWLIFPPEYYMNLSGRPLNLLAIIIEDPPIDRVSSVNCECFMFFTPSPNLISVINPILWLWSKALMKDSAMRIKGKGEKGQPCLSPLMDWKKTEGLPLIKGVIQGLDMQFWMSKLKSSLNPIFLKTTNKKECFTLLKEFSRPFFKTKPFSPLLTLEWMASCTRRIDSFICWFARNPPWFYDMREGRYAWMREASIFKIILYEELHKETCLNLEKDRSWVSLGRRAKKV